MDANGLKFWMLANERDWRDAEAVQYDAKRRVLRLASERTLPPVPESGIQARSLLETVPQTRDAFGTRAYYDPVEKAVLAAGALPGAVKIHTPAGGLIPSDLAMGHDGVLYIAFEQARQILLLDQRDRWDAFVLPTADFAPWRLAAAPEDGVWALDRINRTLARVKGQSLPRNSFGEFTADTFRPCEENADPPRLNRYGRAVWPQPEQAVAIACNLQGRVALLTWSTDAELNQSATVRCLGATGEFEPPIQLQGASFPYSLAWVSDERIATLLTGLESEAPVYDVSDPSPRGSATRPVGDIYPLRDYRSSDGPFLHGLDLPPHYPVTSGSAPLHALSLPSFARNGETSGTTPFDSGSDETAWHRLYLEASIPPRCGVVVWLATSPHPGTPPQPEDWCEHLFGESFARTGESNLPRGAWMADASELPFHQGLLPCERQRNRAGLFTALIQRARQRVKTLRGRYLWVRAELFGDGRTTPELAALRAYGSRFSYVSHYLPEIYHEDAFGPDADRKLEVNPTTGRYEPGTRADFLERFVNNFESVLTPLEDRIANAHLLTDPETAPEESLEWLASWIGMTFDPAYPAASRRRLLKEAARLYRTHGTLEGMKLALDIATGGAVVGGEIIVLEDFRLRRVLATILGADLADENDPLLGGIAISGNSFVGDTLVLGDESRKKFLALFNIESLDTGNIPRTQRRREEAAISAFFDSLAHRVTVLVHEEVEPQNLGLIRRVVELETPAHVLARVETASYPLLVGIASLVGVDTYLRQRPEPRPVRIGRSLIGRRDFLLHPPSLDPRLKGGLRTGTQTVSDTEA
ncbi:MAG: phage tail protein [Verrucomicrobia subdivision 3 bacterium]|nr:phage tail protein [Limisphaerales bacterium]